MRWSEQSQKTLPALFRPFCRRSRWNHCYARAVASSRIGAEGSVDKSAFEVVTSYMLTDDLKRRIRLYSPAEHDKLKAERRRVDAAEVAQGKAEEVQERNRALPHASLFKFEEGEEQLPTE